MLNKVASPIGKALTSPLCKNLPAKSFKETDIIRTEWVELAMRLFWNGAPVVFPQRFAATVAKAPESELHIRADSLLITDLLHVL